MGSPSTSIRVVANAPANTDLLNHFHACKGFQQNIRFNRNPNLNLFSVGSQQHINYAYF